MSEAITVQSVVHERRIEIPAPPGFSEGQAVTVTVQLLGDSPSQPLSEGVLKAFGILTPAEGEDLDRYLEESRRWQMAESRDIEP